MALGKPIITTAMPECKKYKSVIIGENNAKEFVKKVEEGLRDKKSIKYLEILSKEALENTWEGKVEEIKNLIYSVTQ